MPTRQKSSKTAFVSPSSVKTHFAPPSSVPQVHGAARKATTPRQAVKKIIQRLEALFDRNRPGPTAQPRLSLGLFSDGPAPLAKLATQRSRRLKGRYAARADGCDEPENSPEKFDSLMISPGTAFQDELRAALEKWARGPRGTTGVAAAPRHRRGIRG